MLSVGGAIAFVLGSLMLFSPFTPVSPTMPRLHVSLWLIGVMTGFFVLFFLVAVSAAIMAQRRPAASGLESLIGATGIAVSDLDPWGTVHIKGELWSAEAQGEEPIKKGERVKVMSTEGVRLKVKKE